MDRGRKTVRIAAAAALLVAASVVAVAGVGGADGRRVSVVVPNAVNVIAGQEIRADGRRVGEVEALEAVRHGRAARITLRIEDRAWPLTRGSRLQLRWGGTIASSNRYIELRRGPARAAAIPNGGSLPASAFSPPVEFDQLLTTFTPDVRREFGAMMDNAGAAFDAAEEPLRRAVGSGPAAVGETAAVLEDLEAQSTALDTLVRSGDSVVDAVRRADPGIGRLVSGAATTFEATAGQAQSLRSTLRETPRTLASTRVTLARADTTLGAVGELTGRLRPGIKELRTLTRPLSGMLRSLEAVGPDARSSLATVRRAAPRLNPFLIRLTDLMPRFGAIGRQSAEQLRCIRPFSPEIAAFFSTWGDWTSNSDGAGTYTRLALVGSPFSNAEARTSADVARDNPGLTYAFPRPPGMSANQPWFLPDCGVGRDALDPAKDPETRR